MRIFIMFTILFSSLSSMANNENVICGRVLRVKNYDFTLRPDNGSPDVILHFKAPNIAYGTEITKTTQAMGSPDKIQYCATVTRVKSSNALEFQSSELVAR